MLRSHPLNQMSLATDQDDPNEGKSVHQYDGIWTRRRVIKAVGSVAGMVAAKNSAWAVHVSEVSFVLDSSDSLATTPEVSLAAKQLEAALVARGTTVRWCTSISQAKSQDVCIVVAGTSNKSVQSLVNKTALKVAAAPDALGILHGVIDGRTTVVATGSDPRGIAYALLELADQVALGSTGGLTSGHSITERPANSVRSMMRLFTSDVEDKPWFNDREMWPAYLSMLAQQRFNRFNLAFGIGYDFIRQVTDAYFVFTYPFLLQVPGFDVRATNVSNAERDSNLAMLKFIAKETVRHGLEFYIGLWMHGYEWIDSPDANHVIEGITKDNHGPYCRDAVRLLLQEIPEISGVTFRIHGESGVTEGSYDFWKVVFEGVATCGRKVTIDMHTKGMDETMQNLALATGLPIQMSPKYWGEHLGMPYHQSDIRVMEQPQPGSEKKTGLMRLSTGSRSFLRYGYGDLLTEDRKWKIVHRIWPGTQRLLLWGDPTNAAAYSRAFNFCASDGVEIMEMLSFKGRRGSGIAGNRTAYADQSLVPRWDWQKYEYTTRVWGRMLYNPETEPEVFLRALLSDFGASAGDAKEALALASRILPTVLTAYGPSAANNLYWPELYTNESSVDATKNSEYSDSPTPVLFQTASTFDPPLFSRMSECAAELLGGEKTGRYSHLEIAQWLEDYAAGASRHWVAAESQAPKKNSPAYRRMAVDLAIQIGLGEFYANRFRSGVLFAIYEQSQDARALIQSLNFYRKSRTTWAKIASLATGVYQTDITFGERTFLRGHWMDRLSAIDQDIARVEAKVADAKPGSDPRVAAAIASVASKPTRKQTNLIHHPASTFKPGFPLAIALTAANVESVKLHYRRVNQAERFIVATMERSGQVHNGMIPASYTDTRYPMQYFFEVKHVTGEVGLYPGFTESRTNQPYFVVRRG